MPLQWKSSYDVFIHFQVFYILLYIHIYRPGQECAKCDQIVSLNKNAGEFKTL